MIFSLLGGIAFSIQGYIVTASHVLGVETKQDVSKAEISIIHYFDTDCRDIEKGEVVTVNGEEATVLGVGKYYKDRESVLVDYPFKLGQSGSPVFDKDGEVVGVVTDRMGDWGGLFTNICEVL